MEEQVNKLIEKIQNDSISHYDFNEVLDMLKDLLVGNEKPKLKCGNANPPCFANLKYGMLACCECEWGE